MNGEIICSGTELLLGEVINTHSAFISRNIAPLGINIYYHTVVGDNEKRLRNTVRTALERSDIIFITGGLGPTYDDITKNIVYSEMTLAPTVDPEALKKLRTYFDNLDRPMTDNNLSQIMRPKNAFFFENEHGTAPGVCVNHEGKIVIMLPGPPRELIPMFENKVMPYLMKIREKALFSRTLRFFGIGESSLEAMLSELMRNSANPSIAPYAENFEVKLRVTASADTEDIAKVMVDKVVFEILEQTSDYCYGIDISGLEEAVINRCREKGIKITTAESCTGGLVSERLTSVAGASVVFDAGFCCYANKAKEEILDVSPTSLEKYGAVSAEIAKEMALGAIKTGYGDYAVSVTGIAGPDGGSDEKPVGTVFIGVANREGKYKTKKLLLGSSSRTRSDIRLISSSHALKALLDFIE